MFEAVKGQSIAVRMLERELREGTLPQALLFAGPEGSGKFLAAVELARILCCPQGGGTGCGCGPCRNLRNFASMNVLIICKSDLTNSFALWKRFGVGTGNAGHFLRDVRRLRISLADEESAGRDAAFFDEVVRRAAADEAHLVDQGEAIAAAALELLESRKTPAISINRIRELQKFLWLKGGSSRAKVAIVDGAQRMTEEASNSFLKISEDTPPDSTIVITSPDRSLLKETIQSRFRVYRFVALARNVRRDVLRERFGAPPDADEGFTAYDRTAMEAYEKRLEKRKVKDILETADDILEKGQAVQFLSYVIDRARAALRSGGSREMESICRMESLMKAADFARGAVLYSNANPQTALAGFLLNYRVDPLQC